MRKMAMDTIELLRTITDAFGPSGFEDEPREVIRGMVEPLADEVKVDTLGNLLVTKRGKSDTTFMLDAHMDEIGFMVTWIEEGGFLRFQPIGGWDARIIPSHALTILSDDGTKIKGAIGTPPPHVLRPEDRDKPFKIEDLFVDIGADSADEVRARGIRIGSPAVIHYPFEQLGEHRVMAKALDDRAGCAVMVRTLEALQGVDLDVTFVAAFTVQEEVGLRGAGTAAWQIDPDIAIALEGTIAADVPGVPAPRQPTRQGKGPSIRIMDSGMIGIPKMIRALATTAEEAGIPFQYQVPAPGGTDAGAIHRTRSGVLSGAVSTPCRYIHAPCSIMRLDDFENTVRLVTEFVRRCPAVVGM
jgi:endoglucanase